MRRCIHVESCDAAAFLTDDPPASPDGTPVVVLRLRDKGPDHLIDDGLPSRWAVCAVERWMHRPGRTKAELALAQAFISKVGSC